MTPAEAFVAAVRHHQAGQLAEADRLYGAVLAAEPTHAHALHLRGALAHAAGRHHEAVDLIGRALAREEQPDFHHNIGLALSALGRRREAADHWARAVALNPNHAAARLNLGNALREEGRFDEAIAQHRAAAQLWPQSAPVHNSLGLSLARAGRHDEAIAHYDRAIRLQPGFHRALSQPRARLFARSAGSIRRSTSPCTASVSAKRRRAAAMFVRLVTGLPIDADNAALRGFLLRALDEGWTAPALLAPACIGLIRHGPASALIARAVAGLAGASRGIVRVGPRPGERSAAADADDASRWCATPALEKFLAACRFALLQAAETAPDPLSASPARSRTSASTTSTSTPRPATRRRAPDICAIGWRPRWPAARTCHRCGSRRSAAIFRCTRSAGRTFCWRGLGPIRSNALLTRQMREPREEAALRDTLPQLTPIEDATSQAVRAQYEANPYPRWVGTAAPQRFASVEAYAARGTAGRSGARIGQGRHASTS